ncbi:hypothetical protein LMG18090_03385 [Ralstonia mannitolilytica]|nr:hypothetical protein LMG18090_03385 [Ralstonia mannitolilytica]
MHTARAAAGIALSADLEHVGISLLSDEICNTMTALSFLASLPLPALHLPSLTAVVLACSISQPAHALADNAPLHLHIERAPLEHVLMEITRLSGQPLSFASSLVEDRWAGPIEGTMTAAEAARRALEGSELTLLALPDGTLTVAPASPDPEPDTDPDDTEPHDIGTLPPAEVHAGTDPGFATFSTGSITHAEAPTISMPQAVNTITQGQLTSQQPTSLNAALAQAGVASVVVDRTQPTRYAIRGFLTRLILVDGLPDKMTSRRPVEALDELSVIKGPNADVAGISNAGGAINASLKEPASAAQRSVAVQVGTHGQRMGVADLTGPIGADGLAYRVVAVQDDTSNSEAGYAGRRLTYGHAALGWRRGATDVVLGVESVSTRQPPAPATFALDGAPVWLSARSPLGNPDDNVKSRGTRVYYKASHTLSDNWGLYSRLSYESLTEQSLQWHLNPVVNNTAPTSTLGFGERTSDHILAMSNELTGKVTQGPLNHALTLGWDEIHERQDMLMGGVAALMPQNPFAPVPLPLAPFIPGAQPSQTIRQSIFRVRDQVALGEHWEFSASVRANNYIAKLPNAQLHGLQWTPAFGVLYKFNPQTAWFADYSRGFQLNTSYFFTTDALQPEHSRQLETGLRWENAKRTLTMQAALYRIDATNVSVVEVAPPGYNVRMPQQTSDGLEFSVQGAVARGWDTSLWLALSRISGTLATGYLPKAPILGGALWTTYTLQDGPLAGVGAGLGITGRTGIQCYGDTPFRMPGMMRFDTSLFWHQKQWRVDLFARNLFNVRAYENALSGNFIPILPGRTFALRVTHSF